MLLLIPILLPVVAGIAVFRLKNETLRNRVVLGTVLLTTLAAIALCLLPEQAITLLPIDGTLGIALQVDGLSRFFLLLIGGIWTVATVFSFPYLKHAGGESQFLGFFTLTLGVLMGLAMAKNFVTLYMFFEMMTLLTVPLVLHNGTEIARRAGVKYMGYSVFGAATALGGYFFLSHFMGSPDFVPGGALDLAKAAGHEQLLLVVFFVMVIGFGCKAGLLPLQAWLTTAHPVAPAPASAVLSGVITKAGVLAIIRVTYYMYGPDFLRGSWAQEALLLLALATVFVGSMLAYKEKLLKKRLAYSTVSQVSYVLFGLLLLIPDGFLGALLQIVFHALAKDVLFLAAGAIIVTTNFTRVEQLRGIGKRMPITMWCFALASLSLIGIPPMSGFISKWYLAMGAMDSVFPTIGMAGVVILLVSALLTAGYLLPIVMNGFFPGRDCIVEKREVGLDMTVPLLVLSGLALLFGLFPGGLIHWIGRLIPTVF
ncbi:MAG: proton-conducting transporter membrane subunit [Oscillospiraceae bacterium]